MKMSLADSFKSRTAKKHTFLSIFPNGKYFQKQHLNCPFPKNIATLKKIYLIVGTFFFR